MERKQIYEKIVALIKKQKSKKIVSIEMSLNDGKKGLNLNSMELIQLIVNIEDEFNIIFDLDIMFTTIKEIVDKVEELTK